MNDTCCPLASPGPDSLLLHEKFKMKGKKIMEAYYKRIGTKIDENLEIIPASSYCPDKGGRAKFFAGLERMDAGDLIVYAEAVPTWDYVEDGMWERIAYELDLDLTDYPDPEAFLAAAKYVLKEENHK